MPSLIVSILALVLAVGVSCAAPVEQRLDNGVTVTVDRETGGLSAVALPTGVQILSLARPAQFHRPEVRCIRDGGTPQVTTSALLSADMAAQAVIEAGPSRITVSWQMPGAPWRVRETIEPVTRDLFGVKLGGFAIRYEVEHALDAVTAIVEHLTFAPNGKMEGAESYTLTDHRIIHQVWTPRPGKAVGWGMLGLNRQAFDLAFFGDLALVAYPEELSPPITGTVENWESPLLVPVHTFSFGACRDAVVRTPAMNYLFGALPGSPDDAWARIHGFLVDKYSRLYRIKRDPPRLTLVLDRPTLRHGNTLSGVAKQYMPTVARAKAPYLYLGPMWRHRPGASECAPLDYTIHPDLGGEQGLTSFCAQAHKAGAKVLVWWDCHIASDSPLLRAHPDWPALNADGTPYMAGYKDITSLSLLNPEVYSLCKRTLLGLRDRCGIDGVFWDSSANFSCLPVDYRYGAPVLPARLRFERDLHEAGLIVFPEEYQSFGMSGLLVNEMEGHNAFGFGAIGVWSQDPERVFANYSAFRIDTEGVTNERADRFATLAARQAHVLAPLGDAPLYVQSEGDGVRWHYRNGSALWRPDGVTIQKDTARPGE